MIEYVDRRTRIVDATPEEVFAVVCAIGGENGWYAPRWLWRLRGWLDRLVGGSGLVPRRHPLELELGDPIDFWLVSEIEPPHRLRLVGAMKMPGHAIMDLEVLWVDPTTETSRLAQTATFSPRGLIGHIYWISLLPIHYFVFRRMIEGIARAAEQARERTSA